ncbi:chemotaxis protein CheW [Thiorhodococcus mannitoliphagus]|uniref:Chemotaxis protein CheW n=1 Tax=Thiorhodococcus mannitoliphagus TaxID=329406 RepID=A0A6P1DMM9_9GAMM|nr:chemotaxis protein CheW [Thiorhodococcus mannitoliphagus]NEX19298.1 chemotaxis protein CheW [Thiorhodococcus mannitoliphagus]
MSLALASQAASTLAHPADLRWLSRAFAEDETEEASQAIAHAFRIGERWFLIPMDLPAEVSPAIMSARLPFTQPWCLGLVNFRGELVPVYDLGLLLKEGAGGGLFLILGQRDARACLPIDEITVVTVPADLTPGSLDGLPNLPDELVCLGLTLEGRTYIELDLGGLLGLLAQGASLL